MPISQKTFERLALEDPDSGWELLCGRLYERKGMTTGHGFAIQELNYQLSLQLDLRQYTIRTDVLRLQSPSGSNCVPDLCVMRRETLHQALRERRERLEIHTAPVLLVVEVWSPSTGRNDRQIKVAEYQARGDAEIWLVHPRRRTVTAWRRRPDSTYDELLMDGGTLQLTTLPGVTIDVDRLFDPR